MNNATNDRYNFAKSQILTMVRNHTSHQQKTQFDLNSEVNQIIAGLYSANKRTPKYLGSCLNAYFDALREVLVKPETVFLYNVNGQFYRTSHEEIDFPVWDTLPRDMWNKLGDCGGIYWRKSLKPFFVNRT